MSETYTKDCEADQRINGGQRAAQTFSPLESHLLRFVDLRISRWGYYSSVMLEIYNCGPDGLPTGDPISTRTPSPWYTKGGKWFQVQRFPVEPVNLYQGGIYAIELYPTPGDPPIPCFWNYDAGDATYPRGERLFSNDDGLTWAKYPNDDYNFAEFGDPPSPVELPQAPMKNFMITMWEQIRLYDGYRIWLATNVPAHLWLYATTLEPVVHRKTVPVRGLPGPFGGYWCYGVWYPNEQNEDGDTLYHTIDVTEWEEREIRWLIVGGTVDDARSPSIGPIVKKFNAFPPTPQGFHSTPPYHCYISDQQQWVNCDRATEGRFIDLLPSNAVCAFLHFKNIGSRFYVGLRPTGSTFNESNNMNGDSHLWAFVKLDDNNSFDILVQNTFNVSCDLVGYATPESVVMFDEPLDRTAPAGDAWQTVDLALDCPDALGIFCQFSRNIDVNSYGLRPYGSTDNRLGATLAHWYLIGCSNDQKIEYYPDEKPGRVAKLHIIGYVKKSASFNINAPDKSLTIADSYQLVNSFPLTSLAFLEAYCPPVTAKIACRGWGQTSDIYMNPSYRRCFVVAPIYPEVKFEYKVENLNSDLFLFGVGT